MCIVLKNELDKGPYRPVVQDNDLPIKINTLDIGTEAELRTIAPTIGLTAPETDAALNLVRDLPKATTDLEKQNLLVSSKTSSRLSTIYLFTEIDS